MKTGRAILGLFFAVLSLLPASVHANDDLTEGQRLFRAGEYQQAYVELEQAFRDNPQNLDISFALGRAAFELGKYEAAAAAFERILTVATHAPRVKLELARTYYALGAMELARGYFHDVLATNPPALVQQNIQSFLALIGQAEQRHFLDGLVEVGLFHDDNVGTYPDSDTIIIGGLPIRLLGGKRADSGMQISGTINHLYRIGRTSFAWKTGLTTFNSLHQDIDEEDLNYLGLSTGLSQQNARSLWQIRAIFGYLNRDSNKYLDLAGARVDWSYGLNRTLRLNSSFGWQVRDFAGEESRDATGWSISVNPVFDYELNRFSLSAGFDTENAEADHQSYDRVSAGLRYERRLPLDLRFYGSGRYQRTAYDEKQPLFGKHRLDKQYSLEAGLIKTLWRSRDHRQVVTVRLSHVYTNSDANINLYHYKKNLTLTALSLSF